MRHLYYETYNPVSLMMPAPALPTNYPLFTVIKILNDPGSVSPSLPATNEFEISVTTRVHW